MEALREGEWVRFAGMAWLARFGTIWHHLAPSGTVWRAGAGGIGTMKVRGGGGKKGNGFVLQSWGEVAPFGTIWHRLARVGGREGFGAADVSGLGFGCVR